VALKLTTVRRTGRFDALLVGAREMNSREEEEFATWETSR
jgi:hypothetical protein